MILFNPEQAMRLKQEQLKNLAEMNGTGQASCPPSSSGNVAYNSESIYGAGYKQMSSNQFNGGGGGGGGGDDYQIELRVPNPMVGLVIGKGGENIQKMQSQTGVHVQIAKEQDMMPGETYRSIVLKGRSDAVTECKRMIDEIISSRQQGQNSGNPMGGQKVHTVREMDHAFILKVSVPNDKVGVIIGKQGMTIKGIQERSRAQIQIPSTADEDNPGVRTLCIGGDTKEAVDAAQMEIIVALQQQAMASQLLGSGGGGGGGGNMGMGSQQSNQYGSQAPQTALYLSIPDDKVGVIIGKGGATIKEIQNRTRVKITIPQTADPGSNPPTRTCRCVVISVVWCIQKRSRRIILYAMEVSGVNGTYIIVSDIMFCVVSSTCCHYISSENDALFLICSFTTSVSLEPLMLKTKPRTRLRWCSRVMR